MQILGIEYFVSGTWCESGYSNTRSQNYSILFGMSTNIKNNQPSLFVIFLGLAGVYLLSDWSLRLTQVAWYSKVIVLLILTLYLTKPTRYSTQYPLHYTTYTNSSVPIFLAPTLYEYKSIDYFVLDTRAKSIGYPRVLESIESAHHYTLLDNILVFTFKFKNLNLAQRSRSLNLYKKKIIFVKFSCCVENYLPK